MLQSITDTLKVHVFLEDTDAYGVVYHSNYLKYMERARTTLFQRQDKNLQTYLAEGIAFVVSKLEIRFISPALLEEELMVKSEVIKHKLSLIRFKQEICRADGSMVASAVVDVTSIDTVSNRPKIVKF